jgi:hypothetical protein
MTKLARLAGLVTLCGWLAAMTLSAVHATTVAEVSEWAKPTYSAATRLAIYVEVYRLSQRDRKIPRDCLLRNFEAIRTTLSEKLSPPSANADAALRDALAEEIIGRTIRASCFEKDVKPEAGNVSEDYLLVPNFFSSFPESADKAHVVRLAIGVQAALDILNGEDERGKCIVSKFLAANAPGFAELVSTLRAQEGSVSHTVEMDVIDLINKDCGLDAYDKFRSVHDTVQKVLEDKKAELDRKIAESDARLADMRRRAYRLPDGRMILRNFETGRWYFDDDSEVPENLVAQRVAPPRGGWPD